jgi:hypothetical protein
MSGGHSVTHTEDFAEVSVGFHGSPAEIGRRISDIAERHHAPAI